MAGGSSPFFQLWKTRGQLQPNEEEGAAHRTLLSLTKKTRTARATARREKHDIRLAASLPSEPTKPQVRSEQEARPSYRLLPKENKTRQSKRSCMKKKCDVAHVPAI